MKIPMLFLFIREIFAWTYDEIEQLLNDVADAFQENRDITIIETITTILEH